MSPTKKYKPNGKIYELHQYVDPHPDHADSDQVFDTCGRCGGGGLFGPKVVFNGLCFQCLGTGLAPITVGTLRRREKERALWAEYGDELRAFHAEIARQNEIARLAEEFAQAWDEAHAEQARREAMTQGFVAEVGEKVKDLKGIVKVATTYDASYGYRRATGMFLVIELDSGQMVKIAGTGASLFQGLERGDEVTILSGTVKSHQSYKGQDQTMLTRAKLAAPAEQELVDA